MTKSNSTRSTLSTFNRVKFDFVASVYRALGCKYYTYRYIRALLLVRVKALGSSLCLVLQPSPFSLTTVSKIVNRTPRGRDPGKGITPFSKCLNFCWSRNGKFWCALWSLTRSQSNLTKSASRGAYSPVRGHPRGSKFVPLNSWGRVSY